MSIDFAFLLLGLAVLLALLERRVPVPPPVLNAAAGIAFGVCARRLEMPTLRIPPELVLFLFLPPLLMTASYGLSLASFRRQLRPIATLAVGLVLATMLVVAFIAHGVGGLAWPAAFVLGAIVAPPDPVTATSVAPQGGLSHRLVVILEGEGLVNDAVAIVAYGVALQAWATGEGMPWGAALRAIGEAAPLGLAVGALIGVCTHRLRDHVHSIPLEVGISLLSPFLAYRVAEAVHGSGVLAVVALGFALRTRATSLTSPAVRLAARTVWHTVEYATLRLLFLVLGLLLGEVLADGASVSAVVTGVVVSIGAIVVRLAWMHGVPALLRWLAPREAVTTRAERTVLGWSGMRGVVSVALVLALPASVGTPEARSMLVFATACVVATTLFGQGLTLAPLIRRLGAGDPDRGPRELAHARETMVRAAASAVVDATAPGLQRERALRELREGNLGPAVAIASDGSDDVARRALEAQRAVVLRLRDDDGLGSDDADRLEAGIDVELMRRAGASGELVRERDERPR